MLLLEFLLMSSGLPPDDPLANWNREQLQRQFAAWQARNDPKRVQTLCHLDPATVFNLSETVRPTSVNLAIGLGLSLPERRVLRRVTELTRPAHAMLGYRPTLPKTAGVNRRPPIKPFYRQRKQVQSGWNPSSSQIRTAAAILAPPLVILLVIALIIMSESSTGPSPDFRQKTAIPEIEKPRRNTPISEQEAAISEIEKLGGRVEGSPKIRVNLSGTNVTDAGLEHVKGLTQLQSLDLACTRVTDAALEHLKGVTLLQSLSLGFTNVTHAGLEHLEGLRRLQWLQLQNSHAGANSFQKELPALRIVR